MIKICITDDHQLVLEGLNLLLADHDDICIIGLCHHANELFTLLEKEVVDIVLMDINMPDINGIEACKTVKKKYPHVKIIGLSMIAEGNLIKLMIKNGADGYLHKNAGKQDIITAIQTVIEGHKYFSPEIAHLLVDQSETIKYSNAPYPKLSSREKQILTMIINEKTTQEIADDLFISFGTVETHRRNIMIKLGVKNTAGLVRIALEYDLLNT
jgi:DNA-binding NarL/FixJ family response regulator